MLHKSVHRATCFRVLGLRREEPTTNSYGLSYVQSFFLPHRLRMSVSYFHAGMNVPTFSRFRIRCVYTGRTSPREGHRAGSSSNIPYLAHVVFRTAAIGSGSGNERLLCEPLHQNLPSENSGDYRERRCIARAPLFRRSKTMSYSFGPTDTLIEVLFFFCLFY